MSDDIDFTPRARVRPAPGAPGILVAHLGSAPKPYVYVGRAMKGIPASPLGNPYRPSEVDDAIGRFRQWLRDAYRADLAGRATLPQAEAAAELRRLADVYREEGRLTLACWYATGPNPEDGPCHADVIAAAVIGLVQSTPITVDIPGLGPCCARWEPTEDGLPWEVTKDGREVRLAVTLRHAREPLARRLKTAA